VIFRSPYGDVGIPKIPFHEFVLGRAEQRENALAFIDPDAQRRVTFGELVRDARRIAAGLAQRGMRKGDVFAVMLPNVPEFATAFFGVLAAGGIVTTLNPLYTSDEIAHQLKDSGAKYLLTIPPCFERASAAANSAGIRELFVVGDHAEGARFTDLLVDGIPPEVEIDPFEDVAALPYSSGTSGKPKGWY
jgi:acyl-CoA synthetase (AMP-forming)/AMP-acid ligase II